MLAKLKNIVTDRISLYFTSAGWSLAMGLGGPIFFLRYALWRASGGLSRLLHKHSKKDIYELCGIDTKKPLLVPLFHCWQGGLWIDPNKVEVLDLPGSPRQYGDLHGKVVLACDKHDNFTHAVTVSIEKICAIDPNNAWMGLTITPSITIPTPLPIWIYSKFTESIDDFTQTGDRPCLSLESEKIACEELRTISRGRKFLAFSERLQGDKADCRIWKDGISWANNLRIVIIDPQYQDSRPYGLTLRALEVELVD